jgi:hypothetical protein
MCKYNCGRIKNFNLHLLLWFECPNIYRNKCCRKCTGEYGPHLEECNIRNSNKENKEKIKIDIKSLSDILNNDNIIVLNKILKEKINILKKQIDII